MTLREIFSGIDKARIGVIGDFCLDVYWLADMKRSVLSREVPHFPLPVVQERMSPGGAGNVAGNIAALHPLSVAAFGILGMDWRGDALRRLMADAGMDVQGLMAVGGRVTNTYIKPLRSGISGTVYEDPRLDFENYSALPMEQEDRLLEMLLRAELDALCVCDQMQYGCITPAVRDAVCELGRKGLPVVADSRDRVGQYHHVIVKPNEVEAARALGEGLRHEEIAVMLSERTQQPALVTLGEDGCLLCEDGQLTHVPARKVEPPIDTCGAGDSFLSGLACALAAGAKLKEAALFANTASAVTIRKLNTTGTASREEIQAIWNR